MQHTVQMHKSHNILFKWKNSEIDQVYSKCTPESLIASECGHKGSTSKYFNPFQITKLGFQLLTIDQLKPSQTNTEFRSLSFLFLMHIKIINATYSITLLYQVTRHSTADPSFSSVLNIYLSFLNTHPH